MLPINMNNKRFHPRFWCPCRLRKSGTHKKGLAPPSLRVLKGASVPMHRGAEQCLFTSCCFRALLSSLISLTPHPLLGLPPLTLPFSPLPSPSPLAASASSPLYAPRSPRNAPYRHNVLLSRQAVGPRPHASRLEIQPPFGNASFAFSDCLSPSILLGQGLQLSLCAFRVAVSRLSLIDTTDRRVSSCPCSPVPAAHVISPDSLC